MPGEVHSMLVLAPHPYYRLGGSIGARIEQYLDCFDAIEFCHFHVPVLDPNAPAVRLAQRSGKPLLATSDAHRRRFFGQNYSLLALESIGSRPTIEDVFAAIRADRVQRVSPSGGLSRLIALLFFLFFLHPILVRLLVRNACWLARVATRPQFWPISVRRREDGVILPFFMKIRSRALASYSWGASWFAPAALPL